jgi:hypothetical protein
MAVKLCFPSQWRVVQSHASGRSVFGALGGIGMGQDIPKHKCRCGCSRKVQAFEVKVEVQAVEDA